MAINRIRTQGKGMPDKKTRAQWALNEPKIQFF